ncbi:MAG: DnaJ domain-containing protein [Phycisphaerae bacterium]|nr:DnaJ domain-containing protein [Phycisphaerae bacterium]
MGVKYHDYYQTLGLARSASQEEIQRAYRTLARKFHPDVSKEAGADARFKEITEAYEVLRDPEKRKRYDELGSNWKAGQEVPFGRASRARAGQTSGAPFAAGDAGDFSDFFESIFGGASPFGAGFSGMPRSGGPRRGRTHQAELVLSVEEAYAGTRRSFSLRSEQDSAGDKSYTVTIPPRTVHGATIRLAGQGDRGHGGAAAGDLLLTIRLESSSRFRFDPDAPGDVVATLDLEPWEAALGTKREIPLLEGSATLNIPAGSNSGQRLRLKSKGLPTRSGGFGDLIVELRIVISKELSAEERALYEAMAKLKRANQAV